MAPVAHCVDVPKLKLPTLRNIACYLASYEHLMAERRLMVKRNRLNNIDVVSRPIVLADVISAHFRNRVWAARLHLALFVDTCCRSCVVGPEHFTCASVQNFDFLKTQ
jgi:hypothetical protein